MSHDLHRVSELARRLADYVVLAHDRAVPGIAGDWWDVSEPHYRSVVSSLRELVAAVPDVEPFYRMLVSDPSSPAACHSLRGALRTALTSAVDRTAELAERVRAADRGILIDHHLGTRHDPAVPPVDAVRLASAGLRRAAREPSPDPAMAVHVVIPFRDRSGADRLRNLLACLVTLRDQAAVSALTAVTVVESDDRPRWRELIEPRVDAYRFARKEGPFNKSWAVNVGVVHGLATELVCVLDADVLVDREFVARNVARFTDSGHGAHLPCRRPLCLDAPSSALAIRVRVLDGAPDVDADLLRGLILREPPGHCLWMRREVFFDIRGFDERYEGWGGEDDDVVGRLDRATVLRRFDDQLLHLDHPRPVMARDGAGLNAHLEPFTWWPEDGFGDPCKFARAPDGDPPSRPCADGRLPSGGQHSRPVATVWPAMPADRPG